MTAATIVTTWMAGGASVSAQEVTVYGGWSSSWGKRNTVICVRICSWGTVSTNGTRQAPTIGALVGQRRGRWMLVESGLAVVPRGWTVSTPAFQANYLEIPLFMHVGWWPDAGPGQGVGVTIGSAFDVDVGGGGHHDRAVVWGVRAEGLFVDGRRVSLSARMAIGQRLVHDLYNHSVTVVVGFTM